MANDGSKLFNELRRFFTEAEKAMVRHLEHRQKCRAALYEAAVRVRDLHKKHSEYFVEMISDAGGADAFYEKHFAPLATFGEDWRKLLSDVHAGMTKKQYLASTAGTFTLKQKVASIERQIEALRIARPKPEEMSLEEKAAAYAEDQKLIRELQRINAELQHRVDELERQVNRASKALKVATG